MKSMDFFDWQGAGGVNSLAIDDECNAARRLGAPGKRRDFMVRYGLGLV
jgi:hypothetical protein